MWPDRPTTSRLRPSMSIAKSFTIRSETLAEWVGEDGDGDTEEAEDLEMKEREGRRWWIWE